jgi:hypothetical protein
LIPQRALSGAPRGPDGAAGVWTLTLTGSPGNVTAPYVDIDPEAILIRMRVDASWWHIIDADRALTWCRLFMSQGWERRPLSETPEDRRCETCVSRFGEDVVRS